MNKQWLILFLILGFLFNIFLYQIFLKIIKRSNIRQSIREEGPKRHQKKAGTPTMGGIIIIIGTLILYLTGKILFKLTLNFSDLLLLFPFVSYGIIGLIDDLLSIKHHENEGLSVKQKFLLEILVSGIFYFLVLTLNFDNTLSFFGTPVELGFLYGVFIMLLMTFITNATNFTDGLDGLLGSSSLTSFLSIGILAYLKNEMSVCFLCLVLSFSLCGFLIFNYNKAKLFMGDTGSLAIGGLMCSILIYLKMEMLIIFFGAIYIIEILSVILQVWFFKRTKGERIFKMTPLHHHFELINFSEYQIDFLFSGFNLIMSIIGIIIGVKLDG